MKSRVLLLALSLLAADVTFAQSTVITSIDQFKAIFFDGTEIDLADFWKQVGVGNPGIFRYWSGLLDEAIVDLGPEFFGLEMYVPNGPTRFLFFKRNGTLWKPFSNVYFESEKLGRPRLRPLKVNQRLWWIFTSTGAEGSDTYSRIETWYEVTDTQIRPVLRYTAEGYEDAGRMMSLYPPSRTGQAISRGAERGDVGVGREIKTEVGDVQVANGIASVQIKFTLLFDTRTVAGKIFSKEQLAVFREDPAGIFHLNPGSGIAEDAMRAIYEPGSRPFSPSAFLKDNFDQLRAIATGLDDAKKKWLRNFLAVCPESAEKSRLVSELH